MCKFTNRLFVFVLFALICLQHIALIIAAATLRAKQQYQQLQQKQLQATARAEDNVDSNDDDIKSILDFLSKDYDYDLRYDQRQRGNENLRLRLDGFVIGLPGEEPSALMALADDFVDNLGDELLLGLTKGRGSGSDGSSTTAAPENDLNYKLDPYEAAGVGKKAIQQKSTAIIVEIPASKKDIEARNNQMEPFVAEHDPHVAPRKKFHFFNLFNLLRRSRRD